MGFEDGEVTRILRKLAELRLNLAQLFNAVEKPRGLLEGAERVGHVRFPLARGDDIP